MFIILDPCNVALSRAGGGVMLRILDIEGLPGITLGLPLEGESLEQIHAEMGKTIGKDVKIYSPQDMNDARGS